ncbi:MAG TPA: hypothetical protein VGE07_16280 [Herpetosiphonaceae bacterium]
MHALIRPLQRLLALMLLVALLGGLPLAPRSYAQQPQPATETAPAAEPTAEQDSPTEPLVTSDQSPTADEEQSVLSPKVVERDSANLDEALAEAFPEFAPKPEPKPEQPAATTQVLAPGTQGIVTMDMSVVDQVRPGGLITYSFAYRNSGATPLSNVKIEVKFTGFAYFETFGILQWCSTNPDSTCGLTNVVGPALSNPIHTTTNDGIIFTVATISAGQSGSFNMIMRHNRAFYPKAGEALIRPAGSALTKINDAPDSDDSASSLVIGPVFYLRKTAQANAVYPLQTGMFTITLGNSTGPGDTSRPDAIRATNVVLKETIPPNVQFVSADGNPQVQGNVLTWTFASLNVNATTGPLKITYRVLDVDVDCGTVANTQYTVTSNEMPILNNGVRAFVSGDRVDFPVRIPLEVSFTAIPNNIFFEHTSTLSFTVRNYYNQAITGVKLQYDLQTNLFYVAGSASPNPTSTPTDPNLPGGSVVWTFDIPAGRITSPTSRGFSLSVRANLKKESVSGVRRLILPASVPSACVKAAETRIEVTPRVRLTGGTTAPESTRVDFAYIVRRDQQFEYTVDIQNFGLTTVNTLVVTDTLPSGPGVRFRYVPGSAFYGTALREPQVISNTVYQLQWNNLSIAPNTLVRLKYKVTVSGLDYQTYCNNINGRVLANNEEVDIRFGAVCVRMIPDIRITKTANKTQAAGGEKVEFTIRLQNNEDIPYRFGIVDDFQNFTYIQTLRSYGNFRPVSGQGRNVLEWPVVSVPPGGIIEVVAEASMPTYDPCSPDEQANVAFFHNDNFYIFSIDVARVQAVCNRLDFGTNVDRFALSLYDRFTLSINFTNISQEVATNLVITDVLPLGFSFDGMSLESPFVNPPTQSTRPDGRKVLKWTVSSLAPGQGSFLRFYARSSATVGTYENWAEVTAANRPAVVCLGTCRLNEGRTYALLSLTVSPMITMEPTITPTTCAAQGSTRNYRLVIANTNSHEYQGVVIQLQLPVGLEYVSTVGAGQAQPAVTIGANGDSTVKWTGRRVPAKPGNQTAGFLIIEVVLKVGEIWGALDTIVSTTSPDGLIPRKDGALDPTIYVCPTAPSYSKVTGRKLARIGDQIVYVISVANPNASPFTISLRDELPSGTSFVRMDSGPAPTRSGNILTWTNLTIPAKVGEVPGSVQLRVVARLDAGSNGATVTNTATVTASSVSVIASPRNTAVFRIAGRSLYLPRLLMP